MLKIILKKVRKTKNYGDLQIGDTIKLLINSSIYVVIGLGKYTKDGPGGDIPYFEVYKEYIGRPTAILVGMDGRRTFMFPKESKFEIINRK